MVALRENLTTTDGKNSYSINHKKFNRIRNITVSNIKNTMLINVRCAKCRVVRDLGDFDKGEGGKYGRIPICYDCNEKVFVRKKKARTSAWRTNFTKEEKEDRERKLLAKSEVYKWLRIDEGLSKSKITTELAISYHKIYEVFYYPYQEMRLRHIYILSNMLPRKTLFEIMKGLNPKFNKQWYDIDVDEEEQLTNYFNRYEKK